MFGALFKMGSRFLAPLLGGGFRKFGSMAASRAAEAAKQAAINLAKQKAAEAAASAAKAVAEKTGIGKVVGEELVNTGASALGGQAEKQVGNFFQK
jgi:hypothetical protein